MSSLGDHQSIRAWNIANAAADPLIQNVSSVQGVQKSNSREAVDIKDNLTPLGAKEPTGQRPAEQKTRLLPKKYNLPPLLNVPAKNHRCTNPACLWLLSLLYASAVFVVVWAMLHQGDPYRVIFGMDSYGDTCGRNNQPIAGVAQSGKDMRNLRYVSDIEPKACLVQCPSTSSCTDPFTCQLSARGLRADIPIVNRCLDYVEVTSTSTPTAPMTFSNDIKGVFQKILYQTVLRHPCKKQYTSLLGKMLQDIQKSWTSIIYMAGICFGVSIIVSLLLCCIPTIVIWVVIVLMHLAMAAGVGYSWYYFATNPKIADILTVTRLSSAILSTLFLIMTTWTIISSRKNMKLVLCMYKESSAILRSFPSLFLVCFWTLLLFFGGLLCLLYLLLYIITQGNAVIDNVTGYVNRPLGIDHIAMLVVYVIFVYIYLEMTLTCQRLIISRSVVIWFFDRQNPGFAVVKAFARTMTIYLGAAMFGSVLLRITWPLRIVFGFVSLFCAICTRGKQCACMRTCFLGYLKESGYYGIVLYSLPFLKGSRRVHDAFLSHQGCWDTVRVISVLCQGMMKTAVVVISTAIGYPFMMRHDLCRPIIPLFVVAILSSIIAHIVLRMFKIFLETSFLCFCEDCVKTLSLRQTWYKGSCLKEFANQVDIAAALLFARPLPARQLPHPPVKWPLTPPASNTDLLFCNVCNRRHLSTEPHSNPEMQAGIRKVFTDITKTISWPLSKRK